MTERMSNTYDQLVERYLGLESMEITESLLDLCGATIDKRALPLLKRRLQEEEAQIVVLKARGYTRLSEKSEQMLAVLPPLITALEGQSRKEHNS